MCLIKTAYNTRKNNYYLFIRFIHEISWNIRTFYESNDHKFPAALSVTFLA